MKNLSLILLFSSTAIFSQIGIGTTSPQEVLHVDGQKNNTATLSSTETSDDIVITSEGSVGIGTIAPDNSSLIDFGATNRGVYVPKVALSSTIDLSLSPAEGLLVFNTQDSGTDPLDVKKDTFYYFNGLSWEELISEDNLPAPYEKPVVVKKIQTVGDLSTPITIVNGPMEFILSRDPADASKLYCAMRPSSPYVNDIEFSRATWNQLGKPNKGGFITSSTFTSSDWTTYQDLGTIGNDGAGHISYVAINSGTTEPYFYVLFFQRVGDANVAGSLKSLIINRY